LVWFGKCPKPSGRRDRGRQFQPWEQSYAQIFSWPLAIIDTLPVVGPNEKHKVFL
jgi:hypothetical protein